MTYERIKKVVVSLALTGAFVLSTGAATSSFVQAQDRWEQHRQREMERRREREALERIRRMDRDRQLRYRYNASNRIVGYYDRFGRFHAYGYYDRFGRFFPY